LFRPPGTQSFKTKLIRFAAHLSVRVERFWRDVNDGTSRKGKASRTSTRPTPVRRRVL
jgi:hypothetical protein